MGSPGPARGQGDLADMVEMLLDKGVVINADIAVSVGDTELLGVQVRAALASFETAAEYGLEFPEGTDMERVEEAAAGRSRRRVEGDTAGDEDTERDDESEGEGAEREEVAEVRVDDGSSGGDDENDESVPSGANRVAARPHARSGGGGDTDAGEDDEGSEDGDD